jgi:hypothetical protein
MKSFILVVFILVSFVVYADAQSGSPEPAAAPNGPNGADGVANSTGSKIELPPEKRSPVVIPKAPAVPVIDGRVVEEAWKQAAVFKDFYQTSPGYNTAPSKPTEVYMMYDEKYLYIAFKCWDERDKIRATLAKRDNVFGEDNVRIWLDTYNDQRRAYVLGFNPLGIQQDGIHTEGQGADFSVDIVMESKGVIEDWGWSVEIKIPFKSIRYTAGKDKLWGFNVARNIDRFNDEFNQWLPDDRDVSGFLIKHGKITGFDDVKYERTLEVAPSITLSETGSRVRTIPRYQLTPGVIDPGRFVNQPIKSELGVTLKYTLTPSITLDAAINPDFAEIEADAPVITANQRFPIFFEEKRPFFLEGADIFRSPLQVFYSRNIVDPDVAVKLTGKQGKTSFGILAASDKAPGNYAEDDRNDPSVRPRIDEFLDKNAMFAVVRLKRDFGAENNIGFFGTYRGFPEQKNLVAGIDGRLKFSPKLSSSFQVVGSHSKRCFFDPEFEPTLDPGQAATNRLTCGGGTFNGITLFGSPFNQYRSGNGIGYSFNLDYSTERHGWFFEASGRSQDYRADSGFTRRVNSNSLFFVNRFSAKAQPEAKIIQKSWNQNIGVNYDWEGRLQSMSVGTNLNLALQRSTFVNFSTGTGTERIFEEEFGLKRSPTRPLGTFLGDPTRSVWQHWLSANINQTPHKRFNYGLFVGTIGNAYDFFFFDPATGLQDPGPGRQLDAQIFAEVKPTDPLRISASYRKARLTRNDNRRRSFDSDILTLRSTYQFTRFLSARFRLDYNSLARRYSGQALLGWAPSPGKALYIGYNDDLNRDGFNPFTGQPEQGFNRTGRTFFIRASYLFRKSF